jgi:predicted component of type VI protein secretion system
MQIDKQSPIPIYFQIMEQLKNPSFTRLESAWRTVIRLMPNCSAYSRSDGSSAWLRAAIERI